MSFESYIAGKLLWAHSKLGWRPSYTYHAEATAHGYIRRASSLWFEFLKRLVLLAALEYAARKSILAQIIYVISLLALIAPISSWLAQWELDLKTRDPTRYRPEFDGEITTPVPPDRPPAWAYSLPLGVIWTCIASAGANIGIEFLVSGVAAALKAS